MNCSTCTNMTGWNHVTWHATKSTVTYIHNEVVKMLNKVNCSVNSTFSRLTSRQGSYATRQLTPCHVCHIPERSIQSALVFVWVKFCCAGSWTGAVEHRKHIGYYITFKAHLRKKASNQEGLFLSTYPWCRLQRWGSGTSSRPLKAAELTILFLHAFVCIRVHLRLFVSLHCVSWNDSGSLHVGKRLDFLYCKHEREQWFCWTSQCN